MRKTSKLNKAVLDRLSLYTLAATAAGVGALAQTAEAKIVYKTVHIPIPGKAPGLTKVGLDINNDGIRDVLFKLGFLARGGGFLGAYPAAWQPLNGIMGSRNYVSALASGVTIGSNGNFAASHHDMVKVNCSSGICSTFGPWQNEQPGFLGVRFVIRNKVHYGWVRITMNSKDLFHSVVITGYAFETEPNTPIVAGKTEGGVAVTPEAQRSGVGSQTGTLGQLARGSSAIPAWRVNREVHSYPTTDVGGQP